MPTATDRHDLAARVEYVGSAVCGLERGKEGSGRQYDLEPCLSANFIADMEHAVSERDFRRSLDIKDAIEVRRHSTTPHIGTTERGDFFLMQVNNFARCRSAQAEE